MQTRVVPAETASAVTRRMLVIHGWSGVILGLLLYAVIITGALAVFHDEIGNWSSPLPQASDTVFSDGLGDAIQHMADSIDSAYHQEVLLLPTTGGRLRVSFMTHGADGNGERTVRFDVNPSDWRTTQRREGSPMQVHEQEQAGALANFLVEVHVRLYVPAPWGLLLTGVLGLAMITAAITGVVIHRKFIKELFLRRKSSKNPLLTRRDRHVSAGVWNLLFAILLAFTGSYFSFAGTLGLPVLAAVASGGDIEGMLASISAAPKQEHAVPAQMANLDTIVTDTHQRIADEPREISSITIECWGRSDAAVSVGLAQREGELIGDVLLYKGETGELIMAKPNLGLTPSLGNTLVSLMAPLHFGYFAGLFSKLAWFALGCAAAYVTITGLLLWIRRRQQDARWQKLHRLTVWVASGLPLALAASAPAFFIANMLQLESLPTVKYGFLLASALATCIVLLIPNPLSADRCLMWLTAAALFITPFMRFASGGIDWSTALSTGWPEVMVIDILLVASALLCLMRVRKISASSALV